MVARFLGKTRGGQKKRTGKTRASRYPKPSETAELIFKESWFADATGDVDVPLPELVLLGNRAGFRHLSKLFAYLAARPAPGPVLIQGSDPEDYIIMETDRPPFNAQLSDRVDIRFGGLTRRNREAALWKFQVTPQKRRGDSLIARYRELARRAERETPLRSLCGRSP